MSAQGSIWLARERRDARAAALLLGWQLMRCCAGAGAHLKPPKCLPLDRTQTSLSFLGIYEGLGPQCQVQAPELGAAVGAQCEGWVRCHGRVPSVGLLSQQPDLLLWESGGRAHDSP